MLDLQEISGERIEDDYGVSPGASKILASEMRAESESAEVLASKVKIDPLQPMQELACQGNRERPFFSKQVRFYRDDKTRQFRPRNLVLGIRVESCASEGQKPEVFHLFERQQLNLTRFVRSHLVDSVELPS